MVPHTMVHILTPMVVAPVNLDPAETTHHVNVKKVQVLFPKEHIRWEICTHSRVALIHMIYIRRLQIVCVEGLGF
jgi:hypothetical protein